LSLIISHDDVDKPPLPVEQVKCYSWFDRSIQLGILPA